jgi:nucleotide-binding universal stress UspA family protein
MILLHPTDFSDASAAAEAEAVRLATGLGAELVLLHVGVEVPLYAEGASRVSGRSTRRSARGPARRSSPGRRPRARGG